MKTRVLSVLTWDFTQDGSVAAAAVVSLIQSLIIVILLAIARIFFRVRLISLASQ